MLNCKLCGQPATHIFRCDDHYRCDDCGTKEKLCYYTEGILCQSCHTARVNERIAKFNRDTRYTKEAMCPYCGYEQSDSWELSDGEYECPDCGNSYEVEVVVTVEYSTSKLPVKATKEPQP